MVPILKSIIDELFVVQYQFKFALTTQQSNVTDLNSPFNFTLHSALAPYSPPEFIIWAWWAINGLIAILFGLGWYGNRKNSNQNNN